MQNKKRRDFENCKILDLEALKSNFINKIAVEKSKNKYCGFLCIEYEILQEFGVGSIIELQFNCMSILISNFLLSSDLVVLEKIEERRLQLSFLIEGEKIMSFDNSSDDILYESQESYMAFIKSFDGFYRITKSKPYREVEIKLSNEFLDQHGLNKGLIYKKITDKDLIIPITEDIIILLSNLELKYSEEISFKILLEAKILEILASQINNYKNINSNQTPVKSDKLLKTLYKVRLFLKNNLDKNYSLSQLSLQFGLNENLLKTKFKKIFDTTLNEFYHEEKMKKAKKLLKTTQIPIYEISEQVGYKNATHFSAAFKRYFKETPNAFRNTLGVYHL
ncbi:MULTISPECIES: helix-turn-helix transcriptional regulator [Polaribacter]|uniref:AraC family transcriptional regulator n=1 Tax=Polaribacter sejongensis TaxID=985043 RepID=A0AAJ1QZV6_9FLAO|nr:MULTISPECIES: AraC family transcriptional regulator [Polaribacter]MDN3621262.1 AraC family transcriptional regulator [Polaribacter undariae]UWD33291.1 AraC family transcriptional regulator [Polaribacter undariae]